ncbi:MAG: oligogalacturonate lyase family protein [Acidimicrobiales bacterium]
MIEAECVVQSSGNDQLLYFTSTSLLEGDNALVVISDRTGHPNLFYSELASGQERQLTANTESYLKSYVYFDGTPYRGFGKASVSLDATRAIAYYIQGRELRAVEVFGTERVLAQLPDDQMTAFTHVSADGAWICVPTTDARALDDDTPLPTSRPDYDVDERVQAEGLCSYLHIFDTGSGEELDRVVVPRAWITHVQFSPTDPSFILYNHEWPNDCGIRRMWIWDGQTHRPLRREQKSGSDRPRSRSDWTCHEMWERDGSAIIYHGIYSDGPAYIGRVRVDGSCAEEIALPDEWTPYGHFTVGALGQLVTDGYFPGDAVSIERCGRWISEIEVDWNSRLAHWRPLLLHGSSWQSQDEHPHPIFNHAADAVYFTSDRGGRRAVYRAAV